MAYVEIDSSEEKWAAMKIASDIVRRAAEDVLRGFYPSISEAAQAISNEVAACYTDGEADEIRAAIQALGLI